MTLLFGAGLGASVSHLLGVSGVPEEHKAGLLSRVPVVPVVQASELPVSMRARRCLIPQRVQHKEKIFGRSSSLL